MSQHETDELNQVDVLVRSYLTTQARSIDAEAGVQRVRAAMNRTPETLPLRRGRSRLVLAASFAAAVALVLLSGGDKTASQASAHELLQETRRVHNFALERCYVAESPRAAVEERGFLVKPRQVRIWTRGDRFWAEMHFAGSETPFVWGREKEALWAVLGPNRGVRIPAKSAPRPLTMIADVYSLDVDTLLADVLRDCSLTEETSQTGSKLTRVIRAEPISERTRMWLRRAVLEIDTESKALRRLVIARNRQGLPLAETTFTLTETQPAEEAKYRLEGHLQRPFRIHEGTLQPGGLLELLGRRLGMRSATGAGVEKTEGPKALELSDVVGGVQTPLSQPGKKATVFFYILPDCPISNAYAPEIKKICAEYEPRQVAAFIVHADPDVSADVAKKHAGEYGLTCPVLLDPSHLLAKRVGVTMAPEVAVVADGKVVYRGRIDDWYADYGKRRGEPTQRDLRNALDAVLQGKKVSPPTTSVIGCFLPEPKK